MVRGLERRAIFRDETDRTDFLARLARLVTATGLAVYAWALLQNHAHILLRTGARPLPRIMRSLLTGYAGAFNRRHHRVGHLFQNRYKSVVVEEELYLLELVRYLHLNPLRAGAVPDLEALESFPWSGHSALLGIAPRPWQDTQTILAQFGASPRRARAAYQAFVAAGVSRGRRPELQGGGLRRSLGGWQAVATLRRGREAYLGDDRILGSSAFVAELQHATEETAACRRPQLTLDALVARVCREVGILPAHLATGTRRPAASRARAGIAYLWTEVLGHPGRPLAPVLGVRPQAIYQAVARGRATLGVWEGLLKK
jgi:REP element-mobilizing transposase RayT